MFLPFTFHNHDGQAGVSEREEPLQKLCRVRGPAFIRTASLDRQSQNYFRIIGELFLKYHPFVAGWCHPAVETLRNIDVGTSPASVKHNTRVKRVQDAPEVTQSELRCSPLPTHLIVQGSSVKKFFLGLCSSESEKRDKKIFQGCFL